MPSARACCASHASSIGLDPAFTIADREDSGDLMNMIRDDLGFSSRRAAFRRKQTCLAIYSLAVNSRPPRTMFWNGLSLVRGLGRRAEGPVRAYVDAKQSQNLLDYDDLLLYWAEMMQARNWPPGVGARFDHVLVDEYQDTNALQAAILLALKPAATGSRSWATMPSRSTASAPRRSETSWTFPACSIRPPGSSPSEQNYRSTQPILAASNAVIALAKERFTKNLCRERRSGQKPRLVTVQDDAGPGELRLDRILAGREAGVPLKEQAVLFRTSHHSGVLEIELAGATSPS